MVLIEVKKQKARTVYNSMNEIYDLECSFEDWISRVVFFYETDNGGIAIVEDPNDKRVWWIAAHCPENLPARTMIRSGLVLLRRLGCEYLASRSKDERVCRILRGLGFQDLGGNLFSLKMGGAS